MRVHFIETKRDRFQTEDGRFRMEKSQTSSGFKFTIHDVTKDVKVGAPKSFTSAVGLVRKYLLTERQNQETPSTMPLSKKGDNIVGNVIPIQTMKEHQVAPPSPATPLELESQKPATNAQIILAHLASIASEDGTFTCTKASVSKKINTAWTHVNYWLNKFIAVEWIVELEPESQDCPGSYGFNISAEDVQKYIQNMPSRLFTKSVKSEPKPVNLQAPSAPLQESKTEPTLSSAGILAGKAMVRITSVEAKVDEFIKEMRAELEALKQQVLERPKPDVSEFQSVLEYLEDSQTKINSFVEETFGVKIR